MQIQSEGATSALRIFISYRRQDSFGYARNLYRDLGHHFPEAQIFWDISEIDPGIDFVEAIERAVASCDVLIAVIGRGWLSTTDSKGQRRLDNPADFVRLEISTALDRNVRVIPVLVQQATMPPADDLPEPLARLSRRNAMELSDTRWDYDLEQLVSALRRVPLHPLVPQTGRLSSTQLDNGDTGAATFVASDTHARDMPREADKDERTPRPPPAARRGRPVAALAATAVALVLLLAAGVLVARRSTTDTGLNDAAAATDVLVSRTPVLPVGAAPSPTPAAPQAASSPVIAPAAAAAQASGTLTIGLDAIPPSTDPHADAAPDARPILGSVYEALVGVDEKGQPVPVLASSWSVVNDTTWEFKIRGGVRFHNGDPLTANDVKFSIQRVLDPKQRSPLANPIHQIDQVNVVDASTLDITTRQAYAPLLGGLMNVDILPAGDYQSRGEQAFLQAPVGTGPFKFKEFVKGVRWTVVANPDYWGSSKPKLAQVIFSAVPNEATRLSALRAGQLDVALQLPPDQASSLSSTSVVESVVLARAEVIMLRSTAGGPLADRRVRQALNYAVDKDTIINELQFGYGRQLDGQPVGPDAVGYNPSLKPFPHDPARARELLADAGLPDGFEVTLSGSSSEQALEQHVANDLQEVGIKASVEINTSLFGVGSTIGAPTLYVANPFYWQTMDADEAYVTFTSVTQKDYANPEFERLVASEQATLNTADRADLLRQAAGVLNDDPPGIFLVQPAEVWGASKRVQAFRSRADYRVDLTAVSIQN